MEGLVGGYHDVTQCAAPVVVQGLYRAYSLVSLEKSLRKPVATIRWCKDIRVIVVITRKNVDDNVV